MVSNLALADQCRPVTQFIDLGKKAEKCVSRIQSGEQKANDVLASYSFCANVRNERDGVQNRIKQLSAATINTCAERDLQAYTDAATAIQRLYQIELQLH